MKTSERRSGQGLQVLSADEAAAELGLERKLIYRLAREKRIPHARAGRRLLFERGALRRWLSGDDQQKQAG